jgi:hypothetical protein
VNIIKYPFYILFSIWNPFRQQLKLRWPNGKPVLDIYSKRLSKKISKAEINRRIKNKEDLKQCFQIRSRNSLSMSGKSG